jgi:hypothetical protein
MGPLRRFPFLLKTFALDLPNPLDPKHHWLREASYSFDVRRTDRVTRPTILSWGYNSFVNGKPKVCCSSPASICYWLIVSVAAWAVFALIGSFWHPLHGSSAATCLLAMAVGCFANALKNRTYHCMLTGPLFLISGILLLSWNLTHVKPNLIWTGVIVGTGIAFLLEWRYARKLSADARHS